MIASAQTLMRLRPVEPFCERAAHNGMTYGLGPAGYDVRIAEEIVIPPGGYRLASTLERFDMPKGLLGVVHDKSTWARLGICVQNTVIEPGWRGYLTLEITNHTGLDKTIHAGSPIAQVVFHHLDADTLLPYEGKYQDQESGPQQARLQYASDRLTESGGGGVTFDEWLVECNIDPRREYGDFIKFVRLTWEKAQEVEREACAVLAETFDDSWEPSCVAQAIRKCGKA